MPDTRIDSLASSITLSAFDADPGIVRCQIDNYRKPDESVTWTWEGGEVAAMSDELFEQRDWSDEFPWLIEWLGRDPNPDRCLRYFRRQEAVPA